MPATVFCELTSLLGEGHIPLVKQVGNLIESLVSDNFMQVSDNVKLVPFRVENLVADLLELADGSIGCRSRTNVYIELPS